MFKDLFFQVKKIQCENEEKNKAEHLSSKEYQSLGLITG